MICLASNEVGVTPSSVHRNAIEGRVCGWGLGRKLRRVAESGRQRETAGDSGRQREFVSRTGVFRASTHEQEMLGVIGGNRK